MRGGGGKPEFTYTPVKMNVNNMNIEFPNQLFINGEFVDALSGKVLKTIDPATEEIICEVRYFLYLFANQSIFSL